MYAVVIKILTPSASPAEAVWAAMCALADGRGSAPIVSLSIEAHEARCEA